MIDSEQSLGLPDYYGLRLQAKLNPEGHGELAHALQTIKEAIDQDRVSLVTEHEWSPVILMGGIGGTLISACGLFASFVVEKATQYPQTPVYWLMAGISGLSAASMVVSPVVYAGEAMKSQRHIWRAHQREFSAKIHEALGTDKETLRTVAATKDKPQQIDLSRKNFVYDIDAVIRDKSPASQKIKNPPRLRLQSVHNQWCLVNTATSMAIPIDGIDDGLPLRINASERESSFSKPLHQALNCTGVASQGDIVLVKQGDRVLISSSGTDHDVRIRVGGKKPADQVTIIPIIADIKGGRLEIIPRIIYHDDLLLKLSGKEEDKGFAFNRQYLAKNTDRGFLLNLGKKGEGKLILSADGFYDVERGKFVPFPGQGNLSRFGVGKTGNTFTVESTWTLNQRGEPVSVVTCVPTVDRKISHDLEFIRIDQLHSRDSLIDISSLLPVRVIGHEGVESELGLLIGSDNNAIRLSLVREVTDGHRSFTLTHLGKQAVVREGEGEVIGHKRKNQEELTADSFIRMEVEGKRLVDDHLKIILLGGKLYFFFGGTSQAAIVYLGTGEQITQEVTRRAEDVLKKEAKAEAAQKKAARAAEREREQERAGWVIEEPLPDSSQKAWEAYRILQSLAVRFAIDKGHFCHIVGNDVFIVHYPTIKTTDDDTISIENITHMKYENKRDKFVRIIREARRMYEAHLETITDVYTKKELTEGPAMMRRWSIRGKVIKQFGQHPDVTKGKKDEDLTRMVLELMDDKCPFDPAEAYPFL